MSDQTFNGYPNKFTWIVAMWLEKDQSSNIAIKETADELKDEQKLSLAIKEFVDESRTNEFNPLFSDLISHALGQVDFLFIAKKYYN